MFCPIPFRARQTLGMTAAVWLLSGTAHARVVPPKAVPHKSSHSLPHRALGSRKPTHPAALLSSGKSHAVQPLPDPLAHLQPVPLLPDHTAGAPAGSQPLPVSVVPFIFRQLPINSGPSVSRQPQTYGGGGGNVGPLTGGSFGGPPIAGGSFGGGVRTGGSFGSGHIY